MLVRLFTMIRLILPYRWTFASLILWGVIYAWTTGVFVKGAQLAIAILSKEQKKVFEFFPEWVRAYLPLSTTTLSQQYFAVLAVMAVCMIFLSIATYYRRFLGEWLGYRAVVDTQNKLAAHLLNLDFTYFQQQRSGELLSRLTNDLLLLTRTILLLCIFLTRPLQVAAMLFVIFTNNWQLALVGLVGVPLAVVPFALISRKMRKASRGAQSRQADVTDTMVQFLSGIATVKAFTCESFEHENFKNDNERYFEQVVKREHAVSLERPIISMTSKIGVLLVLILGGNMILDNSIALDDLSAFVFALFFMYDPAKEISRANSELQVALPGAERVFEILEMQPDIVEGQAVMPAFSRDIEFHNIEFRYTPDTPVLRGINLTIQKGQTVALVGPSGGGKSTMINLILRFFDPQSGSIRIDGEDIRVFTFQSLREQVALVSQTPFLFNCSVRDNIAYGRDGIQEEEIIRAAKAANIHDDILQFQDGYNTLVGDRGENLSGGQRQRLTIARAIFKNPPILLLDEATSALDSENERKVQDALNHLMDDRTSIVIAHRLSTIRHADQIVVVDQGQIAGSGTHEELLTTCPTYKRLVELQGGGMLS